MSRTMNLLIEDQPVSALRLKIICENRIKQYFSLARVVELWEGFEKAFQREASEKALKVLNNSIANLTAYSERFDDFRPAMSELENIPQVRVFKDLGYLFDELSLNDELSDFLMEGFGNTLRNIAKTLNTTNFASKIDQIFLFISLANKANKNATNSSETLNFLVPDFISSVNVE